MVNDDRGCRRGRLQVLIKTGEVFQIESSPSTTTVRGTKRTLAHITQFYHAPRQGYASMYSSGVETDVGNS